MIYIIFGCSAEPQHSDAEDPPQQHDEVGVTGEASQSGDSFTANKLHLLPAHAHTHTPIRGKLAQSIRIKG